MHQQTQKFKYRKTTSLFLVLSTIFIALSLSTHNPFDPSFNTASDNITLNKAGGMGAYFADLILQIFGFSVFALLPVFLIWSLRILFKQEFHKTKLRLLSLLFSIACLSALLSLKSESEEWSFYVGYGGLIGDLIANNLTKFITLYGFVISFSCFFLVSFYFASDIKKQELISSYRGLKNICRFLLKVSICVINLIRKIFRKKPVILPEREEPEPAIEEKENIVEFTKKDSKKVSRQTSLKIDKNQFEVPSLNLLVKINPQTREKSKLSETSLEQNAKLLRKVLEDFGIEGKITKVRPGPVVTLYELEPAAGVKASRIIGLADDIARSMSAISTRISVIPGRNVLGIELPNSTRETVYLRELIEKEEYHDPRILLPFALGKDIGGSPVITDLARMPHLLIAGTTGSGKSVAVNAMILSYLYRLTPDECKFIMIDPKMLELSTYEGIPHLLTPVVTEPKKAVVALKWAVREMEDRYRAMSNLSVRNVAGYNKKIEEAIKKGETLERSVQTGYNPENGQPIIERVPIELKKLPFIVIIVDEMADLMLTAGKEIEAYIQRLAQMARAAGLHIVMATQRPSVDVITGIIKANFPTRISFQVTSKIDSRTILGEQGAEQLLGMGDMLYMSGAGRMIRVHGPFVNDKEVEDVVKYLKTQGSPTYIEDITKEDAEFDTGESGTQSSGGDSLYIQAVSIVQRDKKASTSYVQRQLKIGYNRAANIIEKMEEEGIISAPGHSGKREVL